MFSQYVPPGLSDEVLALHFSALSALPGTDYPYRRHVLLVESLYARLPQLFTAFSRFQLDLWFAFVL